MDITELLNDVAHWFINNLGTFVFIVVTSLLTFLASWYTARYSWKAQKADERREKVYAPLYDELRNLKTNLSAYGFFDIIEYSQIRSAHLLYLVPENLETQIHELYDQRLRLLSSIKTELYPKYVEAILNKLNQSFSTPFAFNNEGAKNFANDLALCIFEGKIVPRLKNRIEAVFPTLKKEFPMEEVTLGEFFANMLEHASKDEDQKKLASLEREAVRLIESIQNAIKVDLKNQY